MLNLTVFARGNQPAIDKMPTLDEHEEDDSESGCAESCDSYDESTSDRSSTNGSSDRSSTEVSTTRRSDTGSSSTFLGKTKSKKLCWWRGTVLLSLLSATILLSVVVHNAVAKNEYDHFEAQFAEHASKIFNSVLINFEHGIGELDNLAVATTAYTNNLGGVWPYVTVPEFGMRATSTRKLADAGLIALVPLVDEPLRQEWEQFVNRESSEGTSDVSTNQHQDRALQESNKTSHMESLLQEFFDGYGSTDATLVNFTNGVADKIFRTDGIHKVVEEAEGPFFPLWQHSPHVDALVNFNLKSHKGLGTELRSMLFSEEIIIGQMVDISPRHDPFNVLLQDNGVEGTRNQEGPVATVYFPVFDSFDESTRKLVGLLVAILRWSDYLQAPNLSAEASGTMCVVANDCGQETTFQVVDGKMEYLGQGDLHDETFDHLEETMGITLYLNEAIENEALSISGVNVDKTYCPYRLHVYPTFETESRYITNEPIVFTGVILAVFGILAFFFVYYDTLVEAKQRLLVEKAVQSHRIVSSLFPSNVRDRLFGDGESESTDDGVGAHPSVSQPLKRQPILPEKLRLKNYLCNGIHKEEKSSKPIADLFAHCTVLFGDIQGFTAWSSVREPAQVFSLLEHVYSAFDKISAKRRVFKVETIGDCYVAVTGLPDPQPNHASIMVRFARECLEKFVRVTHKLEVDLGPETGELGIRFGMHSGPVTAGVLRGQKSRFQLFGDTVNTAARMESTGVANKIQCSKVTANVLNDVGKGNWLTPREDCIEAKGKGILQTYWVTTVGHSSSAGSRTGSENQTDSSKHNDSDNIMLTMSSIDVEVPSKHRSHAAANLAPQQQRMIGWTTELLSKLLKAIVAHRQSNPYQKTCTIEETLGFEEKQEMTARQPRQEYAELIEMPKFDATACKDPVDPETIKLQSAVIDQLRDYVTTIACSYRGNSFHNFEHAGHVTMSVNKILKRIVQAEDCDRNNTENLESQIHQFTYGITSDPLTHFTCVFASMIHDVDHPGVGNMQLVAEGDAIAHMYDGKSVAEQNSIDIAWELLMDPAYQDLRACIYSNESEFLHFRNLLVNLVMATDIFDKDLMQMRNHRWAKAFEKDAKDDRVDLKATIVIEHIIQASDVAHTMQHWHVYQKWNKLFFEEQFKAFRAGRMPKDPAQGWYKGELWFYDNYIIPLAQKLKECAVFGVASDEFLTYACDNRSEWEAKGEAIVGQMKAEVIAEETKKSKAIVNDTIQEDIEEGSQSMAQWAVSEER
jgi:class 3 adenylate cyclase